jgi:Asp-tRNA(Asn)/Glu-tRNA(Gln) amidotransferase A subunit family amidase
MVFLDELTIDQVHSAYKSGAYTCRQLVEAYLERVKNLDQAGPKLNAITVVSPIALDEADYLDAFYKNNKSFIGPLHGVPVIVKDQCDTKGVETAYGNICCKHIPTEDSTLVRKLREAGAIIMAKSTMPGKVLSSSHHNHVTLHADHSMQTSQRRSIQHLLLAERL